MLSGAQFLQPVDFPLNGRPLAFPPEPFERAGAVGGGAWETAVAAMLVTSWAFTVLRRCNSADGKRSSGSSCRLRAISRMWRPARFFQILVVQLGERLQRLAGIVNQPPNQGLFRLFQLPERRQLAGGDRRPPVDGRLTYLRPNHLFCNPGLVGDPVRELVPGGGVRNPRRDREHLAEELPAAVVVSEIEPLGGLIEQIFQVRPRRSLSRYWSPPFRRMNVSGSSPLSSTTTLTSKPSATSSSHDRTAAPWPAASGSKLRTTFDVNRRSSCACCGVSAVPHEATAGAACA